MIYGIKLRTIRVLKNNTTLFVTNDHGQHTTNFRGHGNNCEGCEHIMLLELGRNIPKTNSIKYTIAEFKRIWQR